MPAADLELCLGYHAFQHIVRIGKTYSVLEFGREHYENVAYFNFETNPQLIKTFAESLEPSYLIPILSRLASQTIIKEKTLIFLMRFSFVNGLDIAQVFLRKRTGIPYHRCGKFVSPTFG